MARVKSGRQVVKYLPWIVSIYLHIAVMPIEGLLSSNCDVNVFGLKVSTYCNLLEKIFLSQFRDALKQSLPLSSPRAMRQIEVKYSWFTASNEGSRRFHINGDRPNYGLLLVERADTKVLMKGQVVWLAYHSVPECGFEGLKTYQAPAHIWVMDVIIIDI